MSNVKEGAVITNEMHRSSHGLGVVTAEKLFCPKYIKCRRLLTFYYSNNAMHKLV